MYRQTYLAHEMGLGDITFGNRPLANEDLTSDEWSEVARAYQAFQHHVRLLVLKARSRTEPGPECQKAEAARE